MNKDNIEFKLWNYLCDRFNVSKCNKCLVFHEENVITREYFL